MWQIYAMVNFIFVLLIDSVCNGVSVGGNLFRSNLDCLNLLIRIKSKYEAGDYSHGLF